MSVLSVAFALAACSPPPPPPPAPPLPPAIALAAGGSHTCAIVVAGSVKCWGQNDRGQLGNGTKVGSLAPVEVVGLSGVVELSAGGYFSCALLAGGSAKCWGNNGNGNLGNGMNASSAVPVDVIGITVATDISVGTYSTCALLAGGHVKCWGANQYGELGNGTSQSWSYVPVDVSGVQGAIALTVSNFHACVLTLPGGAVKCWGWNDSGMLGNGTSVALSAEPVDVVNLGGATQISSRSQHTCARLTGGTVECWGANGYGQLGDRTRTSSNVPVRVG